MEFISVRELSRSPKVAFAKLAADGKAVITSNGLPEAILIKVNVGSFETTLSLIQRMEFARSIADTRQESPRNGNSEMTLDEINAEIQAAHLERAEKR
jgi:hypothetical protein